MCSLQEHIEREIRARQAEHETADSVTSATPGSRWKAGDRAYAKPITGGYLYIGAEEAERLGIKDGKDDWAAVQVVADE